MANGLDIILIPKTQQNESSYVQGLTWLQLTQSNTTKYGTPIWRFKEGVEYLILQTDLTPLEREQVPHDVYTIEEYRKLEFDEPIL